jgi:Tol biopolymer transport system component
MPQDGQQKNMSDKKKTPRIDTRNGSVWDSLFLGLACLALIVGSTSLVAFGGSHAHGQDTKKDSKKEEKKNEPYKVLRITQALGFYAMGPVSNDGGSLLFLAQKPNQSPNLYVMNLADHSIRPPLTSLKWGVSDPSWSPDDQSIAFAGVNDSGSFPDIYLIDLKSGRLRQLTKNEFNDKEPVFTPDGKRLLFTSDESPLPDAAFGILHVASIPVTGGKPEYFTEDETSSIQPQISKDGKAVWLVKISDASGRHSLWQYSFSGNPIKDLTGTKFARIHRYILAPDGNTVVLWAQEQAERQDQLYLLDLKTSQTSEFPDPDLPKRSPCLSPDGKLIAFMGLASNGAQIFTYELATSELKQVTYKGVGNHSPVFVSNTLLMFGSDRDKEKDLYQVDLSAPLPEPKKK